MFFFLRPLLRPLPFSHSQGLIRPLPVKSLSLSLCPSRPHPLGSLLPQTAARLLAKPTIISSFGTARLYTTFHSKGQSSKSCGSPRCADVFFWTLIRRMREYSLKDNSRPDLPNFQENLRQQWVFYLVSIGGLASIARRVSFARFITVLIASLVE